jgi:cell division protein FtsX
LPGSARRVIVFSIDLPRMTNGAADKVIMNVRKAMVAVSVMAIFLLVGGETYANKQAINSFRTAWERRTASELQLQVDPDSVEPKGADLKRHRLAVEASSNLAQSTELTWTAVTNLPAANLPFITVMTNTAPLVYRLTIQPSF